MFRKGRCNAGRLSWLTMKKINRLLLFVIAGTAAIGGFADDSYHVLKKIKIGGEGGWDYVTADPSARRLYLSHGTKVEVLDLDSLKKVGTIPETPGVHGVALAPTLNRGFVSEGQSGHRRDVRPRVTEENRFHQNWTKPRCDFFRSRDLTRVRQQRTQQQHDSD